ncbi:MAG TPA: caspase family protein [Flavipsychrobacter sp.]|nr:caspase family protein [Flavipsychrobacter sp.]
MKYDDLSLIESKFKADAASQLTPFSAPVAGENLTLNGLVYKPPRTGYYYPTEHTKQRICLHFTAGNLRSDMLSLTRQDYHVSVPFVIARDGTIYQIHPSKNWSGHLGAGVGNTGNGNAQDKSTIGIEISNYGLLTARDGNMETIYSRVKDAKTGKIGPVDLYCSAAQSEAYMKLAAPFRDSLYFPSYTKEQIESTIILLRFLTAKYQIPRQFLPKEKRFITTNDVVSFKGIVTHVNYRSSGKWDIGPAFDWDGLVAGVQAASFTPKYTKTTKSVVAKSLNEAQVDALFEKDLSINQRGLEMENVEATDNEGYNPNDYDKIPVKEKAVETSGKVFGLLVGINNYDKINKLNGCVNDIKKVHSYLSARTDINTDIKLLLDADASKKNIVAAFNKHLAKATKNDTVLVYYSGHGTQEDAAGIWDETDEKLECLVCYDGGAKKPSDFLLTDKELRYLINQLYQKTKAHIVFITDCCHSGDNTRGRLQLAASGDKKAKVRRFVVNDRPSGAFPPRQWKDFIFGKELKEPTKKIANIHKLLPEAPHVQIAACESNQSAIEYGGEGVFTKNLLATLNACNSNVTYNNLHSRLAQVMRFTEEQTPKLYAPLLALNSLNKGFMNMNVAAGNGMAEVSYNKSKGWTLNKGAIHNMLPSTTVTLYDKGDKGKPVTARIKEIFIDYCLIEPAKALDKAKAHPADVSGLLSRKLLLELHNWHGNPTETKSLVDAIIKRAGGYYEFEGKSKTNDREADYALHIRNGDLIITRPDDEYRPLARPLPLITNDDIDPIVSTLIHIAQWHFIKELKNNDALTPVSDSALDITVSMKTGDKYKKLPIANNAVNINYDNKSKDYNAFFKITAKNTTKKPLYVAALYLDKTFMSYPGFLDQQVHFLEAGATLKLQQNSSEDLEMRLGEQERQYNWPLTTEFLQFIVSDENFDIAALSLPSLPAPYLLSDKDAPEKSSKSFVHAAEEKAVAVKKWDTQLLRFDIRNPLYNVADSQTLKALLDYEETTQFAAGLFYDVVLDENGQPTKMELKKSIKLPADQKGLFDDFKIWAANKIETAVRRKLYKKLRKTDRMRIVAEGDSWFQYPILVKDTLDHLYKLYAIDSYAEAGDTLENYMKKREYLDAIDSEQPVFFLVSGGGNDILGSQFREFLNTEPTPGVNTPARFLNQQFFDQVDRLEKWYAEMFKELLTKHPNLYIITQSYDYAIPVDTVATPKKTSWLGKYMIEKGMKSQQDREDLLRYMVDQFNDRLAKVMAPYKKNIFFIDVRGLTPRNGWYDEIHPKDDDFKNIADKFVAVIEGIKKKPGK